jgi:hypothetical protein
VGQLQRGRNRSGLCEANLGSNLSLVQGRWAYLIVHDVSVKLYNDGSTQGRGDSCVLWRVYVAVKDS